jgi:sporadic carbohydrate cluster 2OG-Fe(II) oxygenase
MNTELNHLKKFGYVILKSKKLSLLKKVKQEYLNVATKLGINGALESLGKANESKLNRLNMEFNKKSKNCNFYLINSFSDKISKILGKKIFIQRQPYLRAKKYNLTSTATIAHNDYDFGHSHLGFNLWVPLYDILNDEGIYIYSLENSKKIYSKFKFNCHLSDHIKKIKFENKKKYLNLKFGEAIFFSNLCIHGASKTLKKFNRVSSNIHLQNFEAPINEKSTELFTIAELKNNSFYKQAGI